MKRAEDILNMKLAEMFEVWAKENGAMDCADNVIAFLAIRGLLDLKRTRQLLGDAEAEQD